MKPRIEYIRKVLAAFEQSEEPYTNIYKLRDLGIDYKTNEFFFHLRIMEDEGLVAPYGSSHSLGYRVGARSEEVIWTHLPMRLTATGHDFARTLENGDLLPKLSEVATSSGLQVAMAIGPQLALAWAKDQLGLS
ncbi:MAG: hypothetical protein ACJA00_001394 [Myxococcota bacterium]|jgi:hypothetical protein